MTSERLKASLRYRCLQVACVLLLSTGFAQAAPEAQLRSLIGGSPELTRVFGHARILSYSPMRAEASVETGNRRQAIVLFRQGEMNARAGSLYCHAALSRRERLASTEKLIQIAEGDALVADFLGKTYSPSVQMARVEDWTVAAPSGWDAVVCSVSSSSIRVQASELPAPDEVLDAVYLTGKRLYFEGNHDAALERFRRLRMDPARYPNAVLFVYAILRNGNAQIAEQLRDAVIDIRKASDIDALRAYGGALRNAGHLSEESKLLQRCIEIGARCGQ